MINQYKLNSPSFTLESDLAGEFPIYVYLSHDKQKLLYSYSIAELLDDNMVEKPLKVSNEGLSFLLQSGVVPPPLTAYQNVFIIGIGDAAIIETVDAEIKVNFTHNFPFSADKREPSSSYQKPDYDHLMGLLATETIKKLDKSKKTFLFHSAGKDSNSVALALAEAGLQQEVTLVTHKSKGNLDESVISEQIAKKLGFSHQVLHEVDALQDEHLDFINDSVFGAGGSGNFLTRTTAILATVFFIVSLLLGRMSTHKIESQWVDPTLGKA